MRLYSFDFFFVFFCPLRDSNLDLQHAHANHYATKPFFYKTPTSVLAKSIQLA